MRRQLAARRRWVPVVASGALLLAACGGGDSSGEPAGTTLPPPPDAIEVLERSDTDVNILPDVVVDDVTLGNKVNLRNVAPSETPVLLWMWAPH
ncbi:MAG: hypothetical protein WBP59_13225 [Ilumatobacteraceae bacterium]